MKSVQKSAESKSVTFSSKLLIYFNAIVVARFLRTGTVPSRGR